MPMKCYVAAEIGTSHGGDIIKAEELIHAAAQSGVQGAKFQMVLAHEIIHPNTGLVPLPGGDIPLYQHFESLEQPLDFYKRLQELCRKYRVDFIASPFGATTAQWLQQLAPPFIKLASPELNHFPLIQQLVSYRIPLVLSTGVSHLADIEKALEYCGDLPVTLLHCITAYPAPEEEYNLSLLKLYRGLFQCPVGVSDHSKDPLMVPLTALTQGASMIEKHLCMKRNNRGLDYPFALTPQDMALMCRELAQLEELSSHQQLASLQDRWGEEKLAALLGTGEKKLAPSERENYSRTNRSVHGLVDLKKGDVLSTENSALLRSEKILKPGIAPQFYPLILGSILNKDIPSGEGINWQDLLVYPSGNNNQAGERTTEPG
ncbi:MAG: N-acetylneuraminate synthase family protein [Spirochaetaceae bacterium]|jgi:sialic acid synthase SpsE|nr:N-acetylneuraminate synthase family protein [Spirochaetaceae bacterium]